MAPAACLDDVLERRVRFFDTRTWRRLLEERIDSDVAGIGRHCSLRLDLRLGLRFGLSCEESLWNLTSRGIEELSDRRETVPFLNSEAAAKSKLVRRDSVQ